MYTANIEVIQGNQNIFLKTEYPYYYLKTCVTQNNTLVTLQTNTNNHDNCILETYRLLV